MALTSEASPSRICWKMPHSRTERCHEVATIFSEYSLQRFALAKRQLIAHEVKVLFLDPNLGQLLLPLLTLTLRLLLLAPQVVQPRLHLFRVHLRGLLLLH